MKLLSHCLRAILGMVLLLLSMLVATGLLLRLAVPHWDGLHSWVETTVSAQLNRRVVAERVELGWSGWSPALMAQEVSIAMPRSQSIAADSLALSLSAGATLRRVAPAFQLRVSGMKLRLLRDRAGRIFLQGHELGVHHTRLLGIPPERWPDLELERVRLQWHDRVAGARGELNLSRLGLRAVPGDSIHVYAEGDFPGMSPDAGFVLGLRAPIDAVRDARFYVQGDLIDLAVAQPWLTGLSWSLPEGSSTLRVWGNLSNGRITWLQGEHDTRLHGEGPAGGATMGHRFRWRAFGDHYRSSWIATHPRSGDLRLQYSMGVEAGAMALQGLEMAVRDVDLGVYAPLAELFNSSAPPWAQALVRLQPRGGVETARLRARRVNGQLQWVGADVTGSELEWAPYGRVPGVKGVEGSLRWREDTLDLALNSRGVRLEMLRFLAGPVWLDRLQGRLRAQRSESGHWQLSAPELEVSNEHVAARARLRMLLDGDAAGPRLSLAMDILRADSEPLIEYLPLFHLPDKTYRWLADSIRAGRSPGGGLVYRGRPGDFPFDARDGVFELWAEVEDGVLDYRPGWPVAEDVAGRLRFRNRAFEASRVSGRILDTTVQDVRVRIEDLKDAVIDLEGRAEGDASDLLAYLREAELLKPMAELRDAARANGPSELQLALDLPLKRDQRASGLRVQGDLDLRGVRVAVPIWPAVLETVEGRVRFDTADRIAAEGMTARVHDADVTLGLDWPLNGGEARVTARGRQPVAPWVSHFPFLEPHLEGSAYWDVLLRLGDKVDGMRLELQSNLAGVAIDWPAPIGKPAGSESGLDLAVPLAHEDPSVGYLRLGEALRARMRFLPGSAVSEDGQRADKARKWPGVGALQALALEIGEAKASELTLPAEGMAVRGRFSTLDAKPWFQVLKETLPPRDAGWGTSGNGTQAGVGAIVLERLELDVEGQILWEDYRLPGLHLLGRRDGDRWDLEMAAPWLEGEAIWYPRGVDSRGRLEAELRHLLLPIPERDGAVKAEPTVAPVQPGTPEDPRAWPALDLQLDTLGLRNYRFSDVRLSTGSQPAGMLIRELTLSAPEGDLHADATGMWRVAEDERGSTRLNVSLRGENWGAALRSMGLSRGLEGASGEGTLALNWPGALYEPHPALLSGSMELRLSDGELTDVEPGAGRLLGLVSLDMLPRRLRLDFRDVFDEGLRFGELRADATVGDGHLHVPGLQLEGPSARVRLHGRADLVDRDYDYVIAVVPSLRTALPVVGALVGGPIAGVAVLLVERVLGIGDQIEEAARVEYSVTGSWSDPEVRARVEPADDTNDFDDD